MKNISETIFSDPRFKKLSQIQAWICIYSAIDGDYSDGKHGGTGIHKTGLEKIPKLTEKQLAEQFGEYDLETGEVKEGIMPKFAMEYDFKRQTMYNKLLFKHCGLNHLNTPEKFCQGIARDFEKNKPGHGCPSLWWAEFAVEHLFEMQENYRQYREIRATRKSFKETMDVDLAFRRLFELSDSLPNLVLLKPKLIQKLSTENGAEITK